MTNTKDNPLFWSRAAKLRKQQDAAGENLDIQKTNQTPNGDDKSVTADNKVQEVSGFPSQHSTSTPSLVSGNEGGGAVTNNDVPLGESPAINSNNPPSSSVQHSAKRIKKSSRNPYTFYLWPSEQNKLRKLCLLLNSDEDLVERSELIGLAIDLVDEILKKVRLPERARIQDIRNSISSQLPDYKLPVFSGELENHRDG